MGGRTAVPRAVEKQLFQEAGSSCCVCGEDDVTKLTIHHIVPVALNSEHDPAHMLLLCANCHSVATVGKVGREELYQAKLRAYKSQGLSEQPSVAPSVSVVGDGNVTAGRDVNISPRVVKKTEVTPGPQHITEEDAFRIKELINELARVDGLAGRRSTYQQWYAKLYRRFRVGSYRLIPSERGQEAIEWLQKQKAMQRPRLRRTDNPEWRKGMYSAIWARAKELGLTKPDVHDLANTRLRLKKPISSLTELGERNLSTLRDIIFRLSTHRP